MCVCVPVYHVIMAPISLAPPLIHPSSHSLSHTPRVTGRMQVLYSDLPCGQEDDRWHQLMLGNARTARGSLRLGALFKDLVILPVEEYNELKGVCDR